MKKESDILVLSFDIASPKKCLEAEESPAHQRRRRTIVRIYRRFVKQLLKIGFRSQRSLFVVPRHMKSEVQIIKSNAERSMRRLEESCEIFLLNCEGRSNKAVLKSVLPAIQLQMLRLKSRLAKREGQVLTKPIAREAERLISLLNFFQPALAKEIEGLVEEHSEEKVRGKNLAQASETIGALFDQPLSVTISTPGSNEEIPLADVPLIQTPPQSLNFKPVENDQEDPKTTVAVQEELALAGIL